MWLRFRPFAAHFRLRAARLAWLKAIETGQLKSFAEVKRAFGAVDKVAEWHVFDIGGNKYRLIAYMRYDWKRCFIKHVLTHAEYGKGRWKQ